MKVKLRNFVNNNENAPLKLKMRVMEACFYSTILYSCESWGCLAKKSVTNLYNFAAKCILGVRQSTPNILVYKELECKSLNAIITKQQLKFWIKVKEMPIIKELIEKARNLNCKYVIYYDRLEEQFTTPENAFQQQQESFNTRSRLHSQCR